MSATFPCVNNKHVCIRTYGGRTLLQARGLWLEQQRDADFINPQGNAMSAVTMLMNYTTIVKS